jgi:hypothetical protein
MRRADRVASATGRVSGSSRVRRAFWPGRLEQTANQSALQRREPCLLISVGRRRPPSVPGDDARPSRRPSPAEQRPPLHRRSPRGRRDRRGHAPCRRHPSRSADAGGDRRAVARGRSATARPATARSARSKPWVSATPERRRGAGFGCGRGRRRGGVSPNECMRYSDAQVQRDVWLARLRLPPVVSPPCRAPAPGMRLGRWPRGAHRWPRTGRPPTRFARRKDAGQNVAPGHKLHRCPVRRERPPTTQVGSPRSAVKSRTARLGSRTTRCLAGGSGSALD